MKFILLLFLTLNIYAEIKPHILEYDLSRSGISLGTEKRVLIRDSGIYTYKTSAKTEGFAKLISDYKVNGESRFSLKNGFENIAFKYKEIEDKKIKKDINLTFDDEFLVKNNINLAKKLVDNLAIFLVLGYDIKNNNELNYLIADGKKVKEYNFIILEKTKLNLLNKEIAVIKVKDNKNLVAYYSPEYNYLPVLIQKKKWQYKLKSISFK